MTNLKHEPVLVKEVIDGLNICSDELYLDGTFGRGGHARAILNSLGEKGQLVVLDKDQDAINYATQTLGNDCRVKAIKSSFAKLNEILPSIMGANKFSGAVFDLGISSPQLDESLRGFSFRSDGPLDMRMDQNNDFTAAQWLSTAQESEIRTVFKVFGEERHASRIAREIVIRREIKPIITTRQLADLVVETVPRKEQRIHPATRVFQAIRILINRELEEIRQMLPRAVEWLKPGGRLVVISFHSLEDRIVKRFMRKAAKGDIYPLDMAVTADMLSPTLRLISKLIRPQADEIEKNPRARSALLRVAEKIG